MVDEDVPIRLTVYMAGVTTIYRFLMRAGGGSFGDASASASASASEMQTTSRRERRQRAFGEKPSEQWPKRDQTGR